MSATAQSYFNALVALSRDPTLHDARRDLITKITDEQLNAVIIHGLSRGNRTETPRQRLEAILMKLLNSTTEVLIVVAINQEQPGKTEEDASLRTQLDGPNEPQREHLKAAAINVKPADANANERTIISESISRKRISSAEEEGLSKRPKHRTRGSEETDDSDRILCRTRGGRRVRRISYKDSDEESDEESDEDSDKESDEESDEDEDISPFDSNLLKWASEHSVMFDLSSIDNNEEEDYAKYLDNYKLRVPFLNVEFPVYSKESSLVDYRKLSDLDPMLVLSLIEKFNKDCLSLEEYKVEFRGLVSRRNLPLTYHGCLRMWLQFPTIRRSMRLDEQPELACAMCTRDRQLCVRFASGMDRRLIIYPVKHKQFETGAWNSMAYWVRE